MSAVILRLIAKISYLSLLVFIPYWLYTIPTEMDWQWPLLFWWVPIVPPVVGILKNNYYTMSWASFLLLIPFCHGLMVWLTSPEEVRYGMVELLLTSTYYVSFFLLMSAMKKQKLQQSENQQA
jgi:uncharacterized membrane protein